MKHAFLPLAVLAGVAMVLPAYTASLTQMPVVAGQVSPSTSSTSPAVAMQFSKTATVRLLDKQNNRAETVPLEAGKSLKWGGLNVTLQKCAWGVGNVAVQDAAWLDITAAAGEPEFHGWMFNTFPSVATYDHPRYDVELQKCTRPAGYNPAMPARVAPPTPSGPEHENSPDVDDEAPQGGNPNFVVPGIEPVAPEPNSAPAQPQPQPAQPQPPLAEPQPPTPPTPPAAPQTEDQQQLQRMMDLPAGQ